MDRKKLIADLKQSITYAVPYSLTFAPHRDRLTVEQRLELEQYLKENFQLWANSWVLPAIRTIEESWVKRTSKKD